MTEGFSGRAPSLAALAIFLRGEYYAAAAAAAIAHAITAGSGYLSPFPGTRTGRMWEQGAERQGVGGVFTLWQQN
ncbi:unnamed protein product [Boreogadus saida]